MAAPGDRGKVPQKRKPPGGTLKEVSVEEWMKR